MKFGARYVVKQYLHPIGRPLAPRAIRVRYHAYEKAEALDAASRIPASWVEHVDHPAALLAAARRRRADDRAAAPARDRVDHVAR